MDEDLLDICGFDSSKKLRLEHKFQSGSCMEFEDGDEMAVNYPCPFCSDDYDLAELCDHIDEEHALDANNGICPVCSRRVKNDMKQSLHKNELDSGFSPRTKKYLESLIDDEPRFTNRSSKTVPDSLLSFIYNPPSPNLPKLVLPNLSTGASVEDKSSIRDSAEKKLLSPLSDTELREKAKKTEFVQGLVSSTMFNHIEDF
ncbi:unnamed protein product [Microthlaspi erraticum]|uniref:Drought induced 19 protein type zinc-binding domain-containing protein n=1 Tax=Microthlaspi erraticum TaxID=1685480 RepID=A0A6D2KQC2_9BRAS|nr:unnamed protein product [Microthlaspi erraticum]CAA7061715.1 unnamed protein product [Microthlaspi erraticum]